MKTIIMTVGTSLLTNRDQGLSEAKKRPWVGKTAIGDRQVAIDWMEQTEMDLISAETNTLWRLDPSPKDDIMLLHSDTPTGKECAEVLQLFSTEKLGQQVALKLKR